MLRSRSECLFALTLPRGADGTKTAYGNASSTALELVRRWPRCADDDRNFDETIAVLRMM